MSALWCKISGHHYPVWATRRVADNFLVASCRRCDNEVWNWIGDVPVGECIRFHEKTGLTEESQRYTLVKAVP